MICPKCGAELRDGSRVCFICGTNVSKAAQTRGAGKNRDAQDILDVRELDGIDQSLAAARGDRGESEGRRLNTQFRRVSSAAYGAEETGERGKRADSMNVYVEADDEDDPGFVSFMDEEEEADDDCINVIMEDEDEDEDYGEPEEEIEDETFKEPDEDPADLTEEPEEEEEPEDFEEEPEEDEEEAFFRAVMSDRRDEAEIAGAEVAHTSARAAAAAATGAAVTVGAAQNAEASARAARRAKAAEKRSTRRVGNDDWVENAGEEEAAASRSAASKKQPGSEGRRTRAADEALWDDADEPDETLKGVKTTHRGAAYAEDETRVKKHPILNKILMALIILGLIGIAIAGYLIWHMLRPGRGGLTLPPLLNTTAEETSTEIETSSEPDTEPDTEPVEVSTEEETSTEEESTEPDTEPVEVSTEEETSEPDTESDTESVAEPVEAVEVSTAPTAPTTPEPTTATPTTVHVHTWTEVSRTPATCVTNGTIVYQCPVDGETRTEAIPATGQHNWQLIEANQNLRYRCTVCGQEYTEKNPSWQEPTTAHTHKWVETARTEATCGTAGSITYRCPDDGETRTETIPATGAHNFGDNSPTCLVCGAANPNYVEPTTPHVHTYVEVSRTEATCGQAGSVTYQCPADGEGYTEIIPATGAHNFGDNSPVCLVCGTPNPNYVPPTEPQDDQQAEE